MNKHAKPFEVKIQVTFISTADEFWPDGYGPEDPTIDDVIEAIKASYKTPLEVFENFDGEATIDITVAGKDVFSRAGSGTD